ncbi:DUF4065 domain-containing protein [Pasteurellaceae bacterium TAE3-ERU1]|nr:DUF4065 domain-containing protein [Pasteurellaceae bacterium TAE3-ERU1]
MLKAQDVADFFLSPFIEEEGELITNLKLQKLLYYSQGYSLAILDRPIFLEKIVHWDHGPVVPVVYHAYKYYGSSPLPMLHAELEKYTSEEGFILNKVRRELGCYTAWALREKTHQEDPWLSTLSGQEITQNMLMRFFKENLKKSKFNYDLERMKTRVNDDFSLVPEFNDKKQLLSWLEQ